jgi:hypothetical protein
MKYVITESKLNNTIKNYIMENYPDVISVTFRKKNVHLAHEGITHEVTSIDVIIDPVKLLEGSFERHRYTRDDVREIFKDVDSFFDLRLTEYGNKWDINFWGVKLESI